MIIELISHPVYTSFVERLMPFAQSASQLLTNLIDYVLLSSGTVAHCCLDHLEIRCDDLLRVRCLRRPLGSCKIEDMS